MEDVTGAGGVGDWNFERRRLYPFSVSQEHRTLNSSGDSNYAAAVPIGEFARISREVGTGDQVIHELQQVVRRFVIDLINIDNNRHPRFPGPTGCLNRGVSIAAVQMKNSAARNPFPAQLANRKLQRRIPPPQNCPFADTFFYNDDGHLACDAFDFANVEFKMFLLQARQLSLSKAVVPDRSNVSRAQTEARTGRQCG